MQTYGNLGTLWGLHPQKEKAAQKANPNGKMYKHLAKEEKQKDLEKLRENFDVYKRRLAKKMEKDRNREKQLFGV